MVSTPPTVSFLSLVPITISRSIELGSVGTLDLPWLPARKAATVLGLPVPALMHSPAAPALAARGSTAAPGAKAAALAVDAPTKEETRVWNVCISRGGEKRGENDKNKIVSEMFIVPYFMSRASKRVTFTERHKTGS